MTRQNRSSATTIVAPMLLACALLAVWLFVTGPGGAPRFLLPAPSDVLHRLVADLNPAGPHIWGFVGVTALESFLGCLLGAAVALPLAILTHRSRAWRAATAPFVAATQAIPGIALAPLLVLWVGYGLIAVVALCALMVFFPILISTLTGLRGVDGDVVDAARIDGASNWQRLTRVELPMALPSILGGLRNGFTLSVTGAVVGEMVMGGQGLGSLLTMQRDAVDTAGLFSTLMILCALAFCAYGLIGWWERRSRIVSSLQRRSEKGIS